MEGEILCVVCSAHVIYTDSQGDSSNYLYFSQFCGELEKSGPPSDKPFNAKDFFHNVDTAASYLLICSECIKLVNESNEIRINLEKWEMEVVKMQIELLMKLKELDKCSNNYLSKMNRIYDKVKNSVDNDLEKVGFHFGQTSLRKDDVILFKERILDVVTNLALFRGDLKGKLVKPLKSPSPSPQPDQPAFDPMDMEMETADDYSPMQIDNIKDDPVFNEDEDNMNSDHDDEDTYQDNDDDDYNANEEEANSSDDSSESEDDEQTLNPKVTKKENDPNNSKIIEDPPPPLPFPMPDNTSHYKKSLIQYILTPPSTSSSPLQPPFSCHPVYTFLLQSYPWNYFPTSDILTLSTIPITLLDTGQLSCFTLQCSTCHFSAVYKDNPFTSWETSVSVQARRMFEHVVTSHLDGFKCPSGPKCKRQKGTLKNLCRHLTLSHHPLRKKDPPSNPIPEVPKKKKKKNEQKTLNIFDNLPPLPFPLPGDTSKHKQLLIQTILIPPSSSTPPLQLPLYNNTAYTFMLQSYPWNYDPTSDTLTLATIPITVEEPETGSVFLKCSACDYSLVYNHKIHFTNRQRNMFGLVRRMFEHVVTGHLDGFKCPLGPKCKTQKGSLKNWCRHLTLSHDPDRKKLSLEGTLNTSNDQEDQYIHKDLKDDDSQPTSNPPPKQPKKNKRKEGDPKVSNIFDNLPPPPFPLPEDTSKHKQLLIQTILIPPSSSSTSPLQPPLINDTAYTFMLQSYPWNYDPTSDTLTLSTIPIIVEEPDGEESIALKCSTCNYSSAYKHKIHFKNPPRNIFGLVRRTFEHVVTAHLDGFRCSFPGPNCVKKMGTLDAVVKHYQRSHGNGGRKVGPFHCSICGRGFSTATNCLIHEDRHKEKGERDYVTCDTCGISLLRSCMNQHKKLYCGKKVAKCVCQVCGLSFSKGWTLKDHMLRRHAGEEEKRWGCEVCGRKYAVKRDMKNHMINKHRVFPGGMERECRKGCGKKFTWELRLCKHEEKCNGIWVSYQ